MGWKRFLGFDYIDYTDQIFDSLIRTRYAKKQFSLILAMLFTFFIRWHIKMLFVFIFPIHPVIDFFLQTLLSVLLVLKSGWIHNIVNRFQSEIYALSRYLINNYTPENYRVWKRNTTVGVCIYIIIQLLFVEVTSMLLIEYVLQFLSCYFVVDGIEQGTFYRAYKWIIVKINLYHSIYWKKSSIPDIIKENYLDECSTSWEADDEIEIRKSWMGLDNVIVLEDSPFHSIVLFE